VRRLVRLLLLAYPRELRGRFGPEMAEVFERRRLAVRARGGGAARARWWCRAAGNLVASGLVERFAAAKAAAGMRRAPRRRQGGPAMERLLDDLRGATRLLRRAPGFTLLAVFTLGVSIGVNTAVFSVVNGVLLRPLPFADPGRLVTLQERGADGLPSNTGYPTFLDWQKRARSLGRLAVFSYWLPSLSAPGTPERLEGLRVTSEYFRVLGVRPALGRDFLPEEDRRGKNQVAIVAWGLFERRLGGDPARLGSPLLLGGRPYLVVGVLPRGFEPLLTIGPDLRHPPEIWSPLGYDTSLPYACRDCRHLQAVARLAPGASLRQARSELDGISHALKAEYPKDYEAAGMFVRPLDERLLGDVRRPLWVLLGAVGLVLAIGCANVTSLVLARARRRQDEMAVRAALGASRLRLARQLITESVLLHLLGGAAALALAVPAVGVLVHSALAAIPRLQTVAIDARVLLATLAVSLLTGIVFGLVPARQGGLGDLRQGMPAAGLTARRRRLDGLLVAGDIALALVLVIGTGLLATSLYHLLAVEVGFDPRHLLTAEISASGPRFDSDQKIVDLYQGILERVRALPGVTAAAVASQVPLGGNFDGYGVRIEDHPTDDPAEIPSAQRFAVSPGYLATLRIPLLRGRDFTARDGPLAPPVVLVNQAFSRRFWPAQEPIGKRVHLGDPQGPWRTVVGVVGDVRHVSLAAAPPLALYLPEPQFVDSQMVLVVRAAGDPAALAGAVRRAVWSVDRERPVARVAKLSELVQLTLARQLVTLRLLGLFAGIALLLAMVGIYGVLSSAVADRTREIGIRIALGATPRRVAGLVFGIGARPVAAGVGAGLALAWAATRVLASLLFGVTAHDPAIFLSLALLLAAVAALASYLPARRAVRVDPVVAIKEQ
jgi:putative ABC transport system permease protein